MLACRGRGSSWPWRRRRRRFPSGAADLDVSIVPASISQMKLEGAAYRPIEGPPAVAAWRWQC
nr:MULTISPECIES: hypothetical protein [Rhizobium]